MIIKNVFADRVVSSDPNSSSSPIRASLVRVEELMDTEGVVGWVSGCVELPLS